MSLDLGDVAVLTATARTSAGDAANAAGVTCTVTLPDGTATSPAVTNPPAATGEYSVELVTTQAGRHAVRWVFTNPASAHTDVFDVRAALPRMILSLADAKLALKKKTDATDDELRGVIEATTAIVEHKVGPVVRATYTERYPCRAGRGLVLQHRRILEVASVRYVLDGSEAIAVGDLEFDSEAGIVWAAAGAVLPTSDVEVTYTAGMPIIDPAILEAAAIIVDHLWQTRRGHTARGRLLGRTVEEPVREEQTVAYYAGFALPHRAAELLAPFHVPDGFA